MNKDIIYLIVVHDPKIIAHFENIGKYTQLVNYRYLLVGKHIDDYTSNNIIQCDRLVNNIEDHNYYLAYTAWWAVGHNLMDVISEKYLFFLEYDTNIVNHEDIAIMESNILSGEDKILGISSLPVNVSYLSSHFCDRVRKFLSKFEYPMPKTDWWMTTNNIVFDRDTFKIFTSSKILNDLMYYMENSTMSGHDLERFTTYYASLNDIKYGVISPVCFEHMQLDSHSTQSMNYKYQQFRSNII